MQPYPFERLRRVSRADAAIESAIARWIGARSAGTRVAKLVGGPASLRVVGAAGSVRGDPHAAVAEVRIAGEVFVATASGLPIRRLAQRLLGGPPELDAARPPTPADHAIWALVVAAAVEDAGVAGEVWPQPMPAAITNGFAIELAVDVAGAPMTVVVWCPRAPTVRAIPPRGLPRWAGAATLELPIVVARCALGTAAIARLGIRDVVVVDRVRGDAELVIGDGAIGLRVSSGVAVAEVATHYSPRDMALPDDAHLELTVALGTTKLTVRQIVELSIGQIVPLGRPLAGPFELRAAGRVIGRGELIDIDGELGVRVVSLEE